MHESTADSAPPPAPTAPASPTAPSTSRSRLRDLRTHGSLTAPASPTTHGSLTAHGTLAGAGGGAEFAVDSCMATSLLDLWIQQRCNVIVHVIKRVKSDAIYSFNCYVTSGVGLKGLGLIERETRHDRLITRIRVNDPDES